MSAKHHENLRAWKLAIQLAIETARFVETFSTEYRICYGDQFRRAAASVAANIAEGASRQYHRELVQFLWIARGSLAELHSFLTIARGLELTNQSALNRMADLIDHTGRLLTLLVRSVAVPSAKQVPRGTKRTPKAEEE